MLRGIIGSRTVRCGAEKQQKAERFVGFTFSYPSSVAPQSALMLLQMLDRIPHDSGENIMQPSTISRQSSSTSLVGATETSQFTAARKRDSM